MSNILERKHFFPFGGYRAPIDNDFTSRGFTNHLHNDNLGLIYMNARYYLPSTGRFVSADTIVPDPINPQSFNRYSYVINNPLRHHDPSGHDWRDLVDGAIDFAGGAIGQLAHDNALLPELRASLEARPGESAAMTTGRIVGGVASTVQGVAEIMGGAGMMSGGAAACATGVGCLATPAMEAAGAAAVAHGAVVAGSGVVGLVENGGTLVSYMSGSSGAGNSSRETVLQSGGNRILNQTANHFNELLGTNYSRRDYGRALESLKREYRIPNNNHSSRIFSNGDVYYEINGEWVYFDNMLAYLD